MHILWIGKRPTSGAAGDEVFDRKTIAACRAMGHDVDLFHPNPVGRLHEIANLARGLPHYRSRFASRANRSAIKLLNSHYDVTICSWEPFDHLARGLARPALLILHNVTSRSLPAMFPHDPLASMAGACARRWEHGCYGANQFAAIATLAKRDGDYVRSLVDAPDVLLLPPGMPPSVGLANDAMFVREVVISGTFDWRPKRRDILLFALEYSAAPDGLPVRADGLPSDAVQRLQPLPVLPAEEARSAIRIGVITDRFQAGYKLKTLAHIASNQIVLSFADVAADFTHILDHEFFIRRIHSVAEISQHVDAIAAEPPEVLRARFHRFQQTCATYFTWDAVATKLLRAAKETSACQTPSLVPPSPAGSDGRPRYSIASA